MKGTLVKKKSGWSVMYGSHVGREVWPVYSPIVKSYPTQILEGKEGTEVEFEIVTEDRDGVIQYSAKITTPFVSDDFQIGPDGAYESYTKPGFMDRRMEQMLEITANEEFKKVDDEGLFPNHTDKDIWINGFKAGFTYNSKN